jgi:hypothetical protein
VSTTRRRVKVARRIEGDSPRLVVSLTPPSFSGVQPEEPVLMAVPDYNNDFTGRQAYVWVGDDKVTGCFGTIPVKRFLELADAIRAEAK